MRDSGHFRVCLNIITCSAPTSAGLPPAQNQNGCALECAASGVELAEEKQRKGGNGTGRRGNNHSMGFFLPRPFLSSAIQLPPFSLPLPIQHEPIPVRVERERERERPMNLKPAGAVARLQTASCDCIISLMRISSRHFLPLSRWYASRTGARTEGWPTLAGAEVSPQIEPTGDWKR